MKELLNERLKELSAQLQNRAKAWAKEVYLFLSSLFFLKNLAAMVAVIVFLLFLTNWWMQCFTRHGESVQVDNFVGMPLAKAKKVAKHKHFKLQVLDSTWLEGKPPGLILVQTPKPHSRVKEYRTIYLTVTKQQPDLVRLPELAESSYDYNQYSKKLKRKNIKTKIRGRIFDRRQAVNTILYLYFGNKKITDRDIKEGVKIPMGSELEFVITEKTSLTVEIPQLVCKRYDAAEFLISSSNLKLGTVHEDASVTNRTTAFVWKQVPAYSATQNIPMGEQVELYITQIRPEDCPVEDSNF